MKVRKIMPGKTHTFKTLHTDLVLQVLGLKFVVQAKSKMNKGASPESLESSFRRTTLLLNCFQHISMKAERGYQHACGNVASSTQTKY